MSQSLSKIILHNVFSTKHRAPLIPYSLKDELYAYLTIASQSLGSYVHKIGGTSDHIHICCTLPRTVTVSTLLENFKSSSSRWMKTKGKHLSNFAWQNGYASFSVNPYHFDGLLQYIENQEQHHRKACYKEEVVGLLKRHSVEYDERYLWN